MAVLKQRLHRKNESGTYDTVHPETSAGAVVTGDGSTVEAHLGALWSNKSAIDHTHTSAQIAHGDTTVQGMIDDTYTHLTNLYNSKSNVGHTHSAPEVIMTSGDTVENHINGLWNTVNTHTHSASQVAVSINGDTADNWISFLNNRLSSLESSVGPGTAGNPIIVDTLSVGDIINIHEVDTGPVPYRVVHKGASASYRSLADNIPGAVWLVRVNLTPYTSTGGNNDDSHWNLTPYHPSNMESRIDPTVVAAAARQRVYNAMFANPAYDTASNQSILPKIHSLSANDVGYVSGSSQCARTAKSAAYNLTFDWFKEHPEDIAIEGYWTMSYSGAQGSKGYYMYGMTVDGGQAGKFPFTGTGWHGGYMHLPYRMTFALPYGTKLTNTGFVIS